jgi:hypothetical protein
MTIYFAGHEVGAFTPSDASTFERTDAAYYDSTYGRSALGLYGGSTRADSFTFTALNEGFVRYSMNAAVSSGTIFNWSAVLLANATGINIARVHHVAGNVYLSYYNGADITVAGPAPITETTLNHLVLAFKVNSASGYLRLYSAGSLILDSGVIDLSAISNVVKLRWYGPPSTNSFGVSEVTVTTVSPIGWRVGTLYPNGAGTTNTFDSGTYPDVAETVYSDTTGLISGTANQLATFNCNDLAPGGYVIKGLSVNVRAKRDTTGPQNMQIAIRTHATNYFSPTIALDVGYGSYCYVWETNPNTGIAWTEAEIAAVEIGVKSIA